MTKFVAKSTFVANNTIVSLTNGTVDNVNISCYHIKTLSAIFDAD